MIHKISSLKGGHFLKGYSGQAKKHERVQLCNMQPTDLSACSHRANFCLIQILFHNVHTHSRIQGSLDRPQLNLGFLLKTCVNLERLQTHRMNNLFYFRHITVDKVHVQYMYDNQAWGILNYGYMRNRKTVSVWYRFPEWCETNDRFLQCMKLQCVKQPCQLQMIFQKI